MEACLYAAVLMVWCVPLRAEPSCDQMEFLHPNGSCVACQVCGPGEELSEDCGFGDGGEGVCAACKGGTFSAGTDVDPCKRCIRCNLLNRLEEAACSSTSDALCGRCLPGYYEVRGIRGEAELPCVPCYNGGTLHKSCAPLEVRGSGAETAVNASRGNRSLPQEGRLREETYSTVLTGSAAASSIFLVALLLWAFLLTAERFKQVPEYRPGPGGTFYDPGHPQQSSDTERMSNPPELPSHTPALPEVPPRSPDLLSHENEAHPTSIVINVTTNIKPPRQKEENAPNSQEGQQGSCRSTEEMEQKLEQIWTMAQGQSIEMLDYDSIQDLSLLLDSRDNRILLRRLGWSLGVPPQVITHLHGFQDLFQYLRTSTYTLLPQLAQAAALLPNPEVVARIHRAVVNK